VQRSEIYLLSFLFAFFTSFAAVFLPFAIRFFAALLAFFTALPAFFMAFLAFFTVRLALRRTIFSSVRAAATVLFVAATAFPKVLPTVSATFIKVSFGVESLVDSFVFSFVVSPVIFILLGLFVARESYAELLFAAIPSFLGKNSFTK
jgi:hypothetical protein